MEEDVDFGEAWTIKSPICSDGVKSPKASRLREKLEVDGGDISPERDDLSLAHSNFKRFRRLGHKRSA